MAATPVMKMTPPWTPELLPEVQKLVECFLLYRDRPNVLELGSGWSTIWFASMPRVFVESYETDPEWRNEIYSNVLHTPVSLSMIVHLTKPEDLRSAVSTQREKRYDLVLVDCVDEQRLPCFFASLTKVKDDGWIVLDDSHWEMFREIPAVMGLMNYNRLDIQGVHTRKTGEVKEHCTSIYSKGRLR